MKFEEIEVIIGPQGEISYKVKGIKGKGCLNVTQGLDVELGGEIIVRENTWEMYEEESHKGHDILKEKGKE